MIDINELRKMVNAAHFESFANSIINSLLDRIEEAEKECDELRAKIAEMEQQEPFDADSDVFRSSFEAALEAGN